MSDQTKYTQKLKGKKVLITGGTSGIGFAVAEASVEHGAIVVVASSSQDKVNKAIERLQAAYPSSKDNISGHACDLGTDATLEDNVKSLLEKCGKLDHIVHTAGDALAEIPLESASLDKIKQAGMVRFFAPLIIGKYAPKHLNSSNESSIIITTGSAAEKPHPGWEVIASYAGGLYSMVKTMALGVKPIRVNLVSPGAVHTELWDHIEKDKKEAMMAGVQKTLLTGKVPGPEEVAEAYIYLMKDNNVTGTMVSSNGGSLIA